MQDVGFIVLAGGAGKRFGMPKQFYSWMGQELWIRSYNVARNISDQEVVCVGLDVDGGKTRQESVKSGLRLIDSERVVILETAMPLVNEATIHKLLEIQHPSVTYGKNIESSIYSRKKQEFLPEGGVSVIYPLQVFDTKLLKQAHEKTTIRKAPDDASLMKQVHGIEPYIINGSMKELFKVISKADLAILNSLHLAD